MWHSWNVVELGWKVGVVVKVGTIKMWQWASSVIPKKSLSNMKWREKRKKQSVPQLKRCYSPSPCLLTVMLPSSISHIWHMLPVPVLLHLLFVVTFSVPFVHILCPICSHSLSHSFAFSVLLFHILCPIHSCSCSHNEPMPGSWAIRGLWQRPGLQSLKMTVPGVSPSWSEGYKPKYVAIHSQRSKRATCNWSVMSSFQLANLAGSWINNGILKNKIAQCVVKHYYIIQYLNNKTTNTIN